MAPMTDTKVKQAAFEKSLTASEKLVSLVTNPGFPDVNALEGVIMANLENLSENTVHESGSKTLRDIECLITLYSEIRSMSYDMQVEECYLTNIVEPVIHQKVKLLLNSDAIKLDLNPLEVIDRLGIAKSKGPFYPQIDFLAEVPEIIEQRVESFVRSMTPTDASNATPASMSMHDTLQDLPESTVVKDQSSHATDYEQSIMNEIGELRTAIKDLAKLHKSSEDGSAHSQVQSLVEENANLVRKNMQLESRLEETLNKLHDHGELKSRNVELEKQLDTKNAAMRQVEAILKMHSSFRAAKCVDEDDHESSTGGWTPVSSTGSSVSTVKDLKDI